MRLNFTLICLFFNSILFFAQSEIGQDNLIPNPGFEEFDGFPIGWYYKGSDFDDVAKAFFCPTRRHAHTRAVSIG